MALTEKTLVTSELVPSFKRRGAYAYKIPDPPSTFGGKHARFTAKRPYDFFAVVDGKFLAGEAKLIKKMGAFGWDHLQDHQKAGLESVIADGKGQAYAFLMVRQKADAQNDIKQINRLYIFEYTFLKEEYDRLGRNFRKAEIEQMPFYVGYKKDYLIDDFINEIRGLNDHSVD